MTSIVEQRDGQRQRQQHWRYRYVVVALLALIVSLGLTASAALASLPTNGARTAPLPNAGQQYQKEPLQVAATDTATATPPPCGLAWRIVSSPDTNTELLGVTVVSSDDIWAVGEGGLIQHWDGTQWSVVPSPNPGTGRGLSGVTALSSNDVWAVGGYFDSNGGHTLTEHWDGAQWSIVPSPDVTGAHNDLLAVAAVSSNDVWTVGDYVLNGYGYTLTEHWDGTQWSIVPSPNAVSGDNELHGVVALSPNNAWAVGSSYDGFNGPNTLTEHWDGTQWSIVPSPNVGTSTNALYGVAAVSANDVWAVGTFFIDNPGEQTLTIHWDGSTWSVVPSPNRAGPNFLIGVAIVSANDVWAVGRAGPLPGQPTLTEHWDGAQWSIVSSPSPGIQINELSGVAVVAANDLWAVGYYQDSFQQPEHTLIERYSDPCVTPTPVATSTGTATASTTSTHTATETSTAQATSTNIVPTVTATVPLPTLTTTATAISTSTGTATGTSTAEATMTSTSEATTTTGPSSTPGGATETATTQATSTATACAIPFSDVPQDNTFYANIECLACKGIISGYDDGTFRPNNQVTRGQIAKIVSNSAGFIDDPGDQFYQDVAPGSPFYEYINRLTHRGFMGGYPCGEIPQEPCVGPTNMPYFRPGAQATRGQISKIISNAAGIQDDPGAQIYTDVPAGNPFYDYINRLSHRNVMGGYQCGSIPQEPCDSENRPYFRWGNNTTRGQAAKIDSNIFFPDCQALARKS